MILDTRDLPAGDEIRRIAFAPKSLDDEANTVEATFATETPVRRWYGTEVLRCTSRAVDLSRLLGGPVLDSHDRFSVDRIIGRVESAKVRDGRLVGIIRFSTSAEGQAAKRKVAEGMIRSVSVGYEILATDDRQDGEGDTERTVTSWRPHELSLVSIPADPAATIRSKEIRNMDHDGIETVDDRQEETRSRPHDRNRRLERQVDRLRDQAVRAGLAEADADEILGDVRSIDEARTAIFDALADRCRGTQTSPARQSRNEGRDDGREARQAIVDELAVRLGAKPGDGERPYQAMRTVEIGRQYLESRGVSTRAFDDHRVADMMVSPGSYATRGLHTVSDFPMIFGDASNRALLARYGVQMPVLRMLSQKRNARDFRPQGFVRPGEAPLLEKVTERGEVRHGTLSEEKNGLTLETYARIFGLSRKAIINDDLGAFADFIQAFAESAIQTEGDKFYELLSANGFSGATLQDGTPFFHTDRGNLATAGAAPSIATLGAAREAMRLQKNVNGSGHAGVTPSVLLVGPKLETEAEQIVAQITAATSGDVNPFAGKLRVEVENRYEGSGWWLFADPANRPALMHAYLDGSEGPQIDSREGWEVLGTEFRCVLDFAAGVLDWRAAYFNPGA